MRKRITIYIILDLSIVVLAFLFCVWYKPGSYRLYIPKYINSFALFAAIWFVVSYFFKKYHILQKHECFTHIVVPNLVTFLILSALMYSLRIEHYPRTMVMGTVGIATLIEVVFCGIYLSVVKSVTLIDPLYEKKNGTSSKNVITAALATLKSNAEKKKKEEQIKSREEALFVEVSKEAFDFIFSYARIESKKTLIINTISRFNIDVQLGSQYESIVNIKRINDMRRLNKFFESANAKLPVGGLFIDHVETKNQRKRRILDKFPPVFNYIFYVLDYLLKRIFPKFLLTKKIYFLLTRGENRVLTKAETFGRLYSCGFEIIAEREIDNHLYFIARKIKDPYYPENPSYGPFVKLERLGKGGKPVKVYKLRTMHPFAEYLQDYIYKKDGLQKGGKFKKDYRISTAGKIFRKFWLDELPMLLNWFKGDLKLFGVRPLSPHYFSLYNKKLQEKRSQYKPGLIPPYYVDKPETLEEIMASEMKYLEAYDKHRFRTDFVYFWKALFNIIFKRYRSS